MDAHFLEISVGNFVFSVDQVVVTAVTIPVPVMPAGQESVVSYPTVPATQIVVTMATVMLPWPRLTATAMRSGWVTTVARSVSMVYRSRPAVTTVCVRQAGWGQSVTSSVLTMALWWKGRVSVILAGEALCVIYQAAQVKADSIFLGYRCDCENNILRKRKLFMTRESEQYWYLHMIYVVVNKYIMICQAYTNNNCFSDCLKSLLSLLHLLHWS